MKVWAHFAAGVGAPGSEARASAPGKKLCSGYRGATTQRKMDASRLPVIHSPGNIYHFMVLTGLYLPLLPKPDQNLGVERALINLG